MDLYHALNRGVDKRTIFVDTQDYARFVHDMYELNSTAAAKHTGRSKMVDLRSRPSCILQPVTEQLVDIHGWCLMHNHYHLLLSERLEGGLVKFLRKLNVGYAKYFNERHKRSGTLFQGRTKKLLIDSDAYFLHILNYIHLNPLDTLVETENWRLRSIQKSDVAIEHLRNFRWSSYLDYLGEKNFPSILTKTLFNDTFNGNYAEQLNSYIQDLGSSEISHLKLE